MNMFFDVSRPIREDLHVLGSFTCKDHCAARGLWYVQERQQLSSEYAEIKYDPHRQVTLRS